MITKNSKIKINKKNIFIYAWFLLVTIYSILNFILFLSPYWLSTNTSRNTLFNDKIKLFEEANHVYSTKYIRTGYFGLYKYCLQMQTIQNKLNNILINSTNDLDLKQDSFAYFKCVGEWNQLETFVNVYFGISTCLVGFSCVLGIICIAVCFWIIFFNELPQVVLYLSSFIQIANGMIIRLVKFLRLFNLKIVYLKKRCFNFERMCYFSIWMV